MATLAEVAARAGLSVMTASRVLSGRGYVSDASREAVLQAAKELDYVPNEVARSLRRKRSRLVALIVSDIENGYFAAIARAAESALAPHGYRLMVGNSDEDAQLERELLRGVLEMRADALLITPTPENGDLIERVRDGGLPTVQIDRAVPGLACSSILLDNESAAAAAIEHLHARGHRRIAVISGPQEITTGAERSRGALDRGRSLGADVKAVAASSFLRSDSLNAVDEALRWGPTAVMAGNNLILEACLTVFTERNISVPEDLSLVGFDDLPWMEWVKPSITTLRQPIRTMTQAAVDHLLKALDSRDPAQMPAPVTDRFPAELVERRSVRALGDAGGGDGPAG
ncbi:LacI family DNA-binding transcriptional regulator [Streptomyces sp. TS71-3]|uniref:LacI family DNA-binding transcriptional regulator n=1 Tax=Streptomyces sp. TS71-3 TaxID=2733862 RepID=UPI001B2478DE|nr:LacI family DNA-binding transcriptional regulator [Streptomyces sp. TS71-3]GHJ39403.1 LacI family transcriptional regulator [Streptomyces sp. TS71-3]